MIPKIRFKGYNDKYTEYLVSDIIEYKQPNKFIVSNTNYSNKYKTPVITPGKTFILGYTNDKHNIITSPTIVFDDFTAQVRYIDFNFKVKSSALKLLYANEDLKYMFYLLQKLRFIPQEHKRQYLSVVSQITIHIPSVEEQQKISSFIYDIDELIELKNKKIELKKIKKKYYLQNMF